MGASATIHAPVFFIDYAYFKEQPSIPNFSICNQKLATTNMIDRSTSALIFVSYTWLRKFKGDLGWTGLPDPDNDRRDLFRLLTAGIDIFIAEFCPLVKTVYLWMDFCCVLQDLDNDANFTSRMMVNLEQVIEACDCLFTPLYSPKDIDKDADLLTYSEHPQFSWYNQNSQKV
jgi:hypothetical protein